MWYRGKVWILSTDQNKNSNIIHLQNPDDRSKGITTTKDKIISVTNKQLKACEILWGKL